MSVIYFVWKIGKREGISLKKKIIKKADKQVSRFSTSLNIIFYLMSSSIVAIKHIIIKGYSYRIYILERFKYNNCYL